MTSPFDWKGKPSVLLTGKDKNAFNGVNRSKKQSSEVIAKAAKKPR